MTASNATAAKELSQYDGLNVYSVKVTSTAASGVIQQNLSADKLKLVKNRNITLAVRVYVPTGQASSAGRIGLTTSSSTFNTYTISGDAKDGWVWRVVSQKVKSTDTYVRISLFGDSAGGGGFAYFDRAILITGSLPADKL